MNPVESCEVCGMDVAPGEGVRLEMAVEDLMCPTPMSFHDHCYESVKDVWNEPTGATTCQVDPEFPDETGKWLEVSRRTSDTPAR